MNRFRMLISVLLITALICSCSAPSNDKDDTSSELDISNFEALTDIDDSRPDVYVIVKVMDTKPELFMTT